MAAAMPSKLVAVAVLVALMCAIAVQAQQSPSVGGAPVCDLVDQDVVNACFKSLGEGDIVGKASRKDSNGNVVKFDVDCCRAFGGHSCLCKMKKVWETSKSKTALNKALGVKCVKDKTC